MGNPFGFTGFEMPFLDTLISGIQSVVLPPGTIGFSLTGIREARGSPRHEVFFPFIRAGFMFDGCKSRVADKPVRNGKAIDILA